MTISWRMGKSCRAICKWVILCAFFFPRLSMGRLPCWLWKVLHTYETLVASHTDNIRDCKWKQTIMKCVTPGFVPLFIRKCAPRFSPTRYQWITLWWGGNAQRVNDWCGIQQAGERLVSVFYVKILLIFRYNGCIWVLVEVVDGLAM